MSKLREIRIRKGLLQKDIAEILKVDQVSVSRYELGKRRLGQDEIIKLSLALEVTPNELLGFEEAYKKHVNYLMSLKENENEEN